MPINLEAIDSAATERDAASKATVASTTRVCADESCNVEVVGKATLCRAHKAAANEKRRKGYRNLVREAATKANATDATDNATAFVRITDGRSGFAYHVKAEMVNYYVDSNDHEYGGTLLQGFDSFANAVAFAGVLANSDVATDEGWTAEVIATDTVANLSSQGLGDELATVTFKG